jgi:hypothetical protein
MMFFNIFENYPKAKKATKVLLNLIFGLQPIKKGENAGFILCVSGDI